MHTPGYRINLVSQSVRYLLFLTATALLFVQSDIRAQQVANPPKVVIISLDGCAPRFVNEFLANGVLSNNSGIGLIKSSGFSAMQNSVTTPSLTAVSHVAMATGSTAVNNDINSNTYMLVASPLGSTISGFGGPIGGYNYSLNGTPSAFPNALMAQARCADGCGGACVSGPSSKLYAAIRAANPVADSVQTKLTAQPIWVTLRAQGKKVVAATWPGADGADITIPGRPSSPIIQPQTVRTVDYTVPFGAFAFISGRGFAFTSTDFTALAPNDPIVTALTNAGHTSFSPVMMKSGIETVTNIGGKNFTFNVVAIDTTNDSTPNYDTLVFFDSTNGIAGPFTPAPLGTGPAYVKNNGKTVPFYLEGTSNKSGLAWFVSALSPDLSTVHIMHTSNQCINPTPNNAAVQANIDDINNNVGFWGYQPDFRFPERINSGLTAFSDLELESFYEATLADWVDYQTRVTIRAIQQNPGADLVMTYIEQPDGSEHQFLLTDRRQPTDFTNPASIGAGQDPAKVLRYAGYIANAYKTADSAVNKIIQACGVDANGKPLSNIFVVSDHGFETFHTAVNLTQALVNAGIDAGFTATHAVRVVTSGPAANIYINLQGREQAGIVTPANYITLQQQIVTVLQGLTDTNVNYTNGAASVNVFDKVYARPADINSPNFGFQTGPFISQDSGDVFAIMTVGYNFDGVQGNGVVRMGDPTVAIPVLSLPNFYGAHGYDPNLANMSAICYAAGPDIPANTTANMKSIDINPTITKLLGVQPALTVDGTALPMLNRIPVLVSSAAAAPSPATIGQTVSFNVTATDPDADTILITWNFGDGSTATGSNSSHVYQTAGVFNAVATVTDGRGGSVSSIAIVTVNAPVPTPNHVPVFTNAPSASPSTAGAGQSVLFSALATDADNEVLTYSWNFGDNAAATGPLVSHVYSAAGTFTVTLTVTDPHGGTVTGTVPVTVSAPALGSGLDSDGDGFSDAIEKLANSNPFDANSKPLNLKTAATSALTVNSLKIKLNFKQTGKDTIMLQATVPAFAASGQQVLIDVGGVGTVQTFDRRGHSKSSGATTMVDSKGKVKVTLSGAFASTLASSQLVNADTNSTVNVPVTLLINGTALTKNVQLQYKAKKNSSGLAQ